MNRVMAEREKGPASLAPAGPIQHRIDSWALARASLLLEELSCLRQCTDRAEQTGPASPAP